MEPEPRAFVGTLGEMKRRSDRTIDPKGCRYHLLRPDTRR
jgi:hypothetical protein